MTQSIGSYIRKRREELGLTQRAVALAAGFKSIAHLSDIEGGNRNPGPEAMPKLAEALKVSLAELEAHDARVPLQATKEFLETHPHMAAAFRRIVEHTRTLSADEVLRRIEKPASQVANPTSCPRAPLPTSQPPSRPESYTTA